MPEQTARGRVERIQRVLRRGSDDYIVYLSAHLDSSEEERLRYHLAIETGTPLQRQICHIRSGYA